MEIKQIFLIITELYLFYANCCFAGSYGTDRIYVSKILSIEPKKKTNSDQNCAEEARHGLRAGERGFLDLERELGMIQILVRKAAKKLFCGETTKRW